MAREDGLDKTGANVETTTLRPTEAPCQLPSYVSTVTPSTALSVPSPAAAPQAIPGASGAGTPSSSGSGGSSLERDCPAGLGVSGKDGPDGVDCGKCVETGEKKKRATKANAKCHAALGNGRFCTHRFDSHDAGCKVEDCGCGGFVAAPKRKTRGSTIVLRGADADAFARAAGAYGSDAKPAEKPGCGRSMPGPEAGRSVACGSKVGGALVLHEGCRATAVEGDASSPWRFPSHDCPPQLALCLCRHFRARHPRDGQCAMCGPACPAYQAEVAEAAPSKAEAAERPVARVDHVGVEQRQLGGECATPSLALSEARHPQVPLSGGATSHLTSSEPTSGSRAPSPLLVAAETGAAPAQEVGDSAPHTATDAELSAALAVPFTFRASIICTRCKRRVRGADDVCWVCTGGPSTISDGRPVIVEEALWSIDVTAAAALAGASPASKPVHASDASGAPTKNGETSPAISPSPASGSDAHLPALPGGIDLPSWAVGRPVEGGSVVAVPPAIPRPGRDASEAPASSSAVPAGRVAQEIASAAVSLPPDDSSARKVMDAADQAAKARTHAEAIVANIAAEREKQAAAAQVHVGEGVLIEGPGASAFAEAMAEEHQKREGPPKPSRIVHGDRAQAEYAAIKGMNWSTLKHMARSPKMFKWRLDHPEPPKPAYDFGRAFHCALLEPKEFLERFVVEPDFGDCRKTANKADRDAWRAANTTRELISQADMDTVLGMADAVRAHKVAKELLDGVRAEETITWTDAETGVKCKARLDMLGKHFLTDVKTSRDPEPGAFARDASKHMYHGQMAFYHDGAIASGRLPKDAETPRFIVPEKAEPFDVVVFKMHLNMALDVGRKLYRRLLGRFVECDAAGWWPGMSPELRLLEMPAWAPGASDGPTSEFDLADAT